MPRRLAKATDREGLQYLLRRRKPLGQQRVQESVCGQGVVVFIESGVFRFIIILLLSPWEDEL